MMWEDLIGWAFLFALFHGLAAWFIYLYLQGLEIALNYAIAFSLGFWVYAIPYRILPSIFR